MHWVPRAVLYLLKEEGGQGIVDLKSRKAAFRLQFVQKFLYKSNLSWTGLTFCLLSKVGGWGFGKNLFWMDCTKFDLRFISPFYESVRKIWALVQAKRSLPYESLYWFLEEPLINGARLDLCDDTTPWLKQVLTNAKIVKMKSLMEVAGKTLDNYTALAQKLGMRSTRIIYLLLKKFRETLSKEDWTILLSQTVPNVTDHFPRMVIPRTVLERGNSSSSLKIVRDFVFDSMGGLSLYQVCVKVINRDKLQRVDTPWRGHLSIENDVKPFWGSIYKPPLTKKVGDLQWRVLHGIIAVNAFISILNPTVQDKCPFCMNRETIFHCFMHCERLSSLFVLLETLFSCVDEVFTMTVFIFGFKYCKNKKRKGRLLNFIVGQAKLAIYISRRYKILYDSNCVVELVFKGLIKVRIRHNFTFYLSMKKVENFEDIWSVENLLCWVDNDVLAFSDGIM